jgi:hypothetical protein
MKRKLQVRKLLVISAIALLLCLVFLSYLQPGFIVDFANRYNLC